MQTFTADDDSSQKTLLDLWRAAWPQALTVWSKYTRLSDPKLCDSEIKARDEGLQGSFAMIRLVDQAVIVNLKDVQKYALEDYAIEILAHEIGHHVLAPANVSDHLRLITHIRTALPTLEAHAAMIANLYTDLLINDRLQRRSGLRMAQVYKQLRQHSECASATQSGLWQLYMRIYELLWQLPKGDLVGGTIERKMEVDAWLGSRLIRVYANEWLHAGGRFASLLLPYLVEDIENSMDSIAAMLDTKDAAVGANPVGITEIEQGELGGAVHPANDERITGEAVKPGDEVTAVSTSDGQRREPFEYGEILRLAGIRLTAHEMAIRYYRESALPYLVAFPKRQQPRSVEPLIEGFEPWDIGDPLDQIDWFETLTRSPTVFSGMTTVKRQYGEEVGFERSTIPVDLDIYIDSSGSMPNPQQQVSYMTLAAAIIALSALRAGSKVQATLWSGKHQVNSTQGFVRNEYDILQVIIGFFGGATAFPIHVLRDTHINSRKEGVACHILMISDDGITTMFDQDEQGNSGWEISAEVLKKAAGGGTMALNIPANWKKQLRQNDGNDLIRAQQEQGWDIYAISKLQDLVDFAQEFSRRHYGASEIKSMRQT